MLELVTAFCMGGPLDGQTHTMPLGKNYSFNGEKYDLYPSANEGAPGLWVHESLTPKDVQMMLADAYCQHRRLIEALEPSGSTKYAYSSEFHFFKTLSGYDEDGDPIEEVVEVTVPWTTIKDIMAAIRSRAITPVKQEAAQ